jgi:tRNA (adenine37-N6)-methyltransferase
MTNEVIFRPIGHIRSPFASRGEAPRQAALAREVEAVIEVLPELQEGLDDLDGFSHIIILYHLHLSQGFELKVVPPVDTKERGLFASRGPRRPNSIGLAVVKLERVEENRVFIRGVDMLNGTPVLDIKPYIPDLDSRPDATTGWVAETTQSLGVTKTPEPYIEED